MTTEQSLAFAILAGTLVLFASGRMRHDFVAVVSLIAVALSGLTAPAAIFSGFGHPAVITVAAVLMISAALSRAGVVALAARSLGDYTENQAAHFLVLTGVVAALSAFINNVGALALMMPVALATAKARGRSPALLLMPLAFAAILGGMITLIGTPPNIIISAIRAEELGASFQMFDFAPVGAPVAVVGVLFVALVGWRFLPAERQKEDQQEALFNVGGYLTELKVLPGGPLDGAALRDASLFREAGAQLYGLVRETGENGETRRLPTVGYQVLAAGDVLIVSVESDALAGLLEAGGLEPVAEARERSLNLEGDVDWSDAALLEVVVSPGSPLIGRSVRVIDRISGQSASAIALARQGATRRGRLRDQMLEGGDVVLLQGAPETLRELVERYQLWPLAERGVSLGQAAGGGPWRALAIFAVALALAISGVVSIGVAFLMAVLAYVVLGALPARDLYESVDWSILVLLGAMFPLGAALEETGATELVAGWVVSGADGLGLAPFGVMVLTMVATMFLSDLINNAATALLMGPLSIRIAEAVGANPDPFLMAVAVGASCAFLTPIGHQCNTLVMGPGGYRFGDYWRMGLPLEALIVLTAAPAIAWAWPL